MAKRKEKWITVPQNVSQLREILPDSWKATWGQSGMAPGNHSMTVMRCAQIVLPTQGATFFGASKKAVTHYAYTWLVAIGVLLLPTVRRVKRKRRRKPGKPSPQCQEW